MIKLAMELPPCKHVEWSPLADLDFVLAHIVLQDASYARVLQERAPDRALILDNSLHELGYPLPVSDLIEAAKRCRATYVIAPDRVGDCAWNAEQFYAARKALYPAYKIAVVMTGDRTLGEMQGYAEREQFLWDVREADMLAVTFKEEKRFDWYIESNLAKRWKRVHLLGVSELDELLQWTSYVEGRTALLGTSCFSVDTGKCLKWALRGKHLDELASLRTNAHTTSQGLPSEVSQHILSLTAKQISPSVEAIFRQNVRILKQVCGQSAS